MAGLSERRLFFILILLSIIYLIIVSFIVPDGGEALKKANEKRPRHMIKPVDENLTGRPVKYPYKECSELERPDLNLLESFEWHQVSSKMFVYSAYFDDRASEKYIKIWGMLADHSVDDSPSDSTSGLYCQVWYHNRQLPVIRSAKYLIVPETREKRYAPAMFICTVIRHDPPYAISLVTNKCDHPTHVLPVDLPPGIPPWHKFTVCVSPLNKLHDDIYALTEMVEINRILGADKIVFYNHTTGHHFHKYLDYYISKRVVDVIPWKLPVTVESDEPDPGISPAVPYFGQVVAFNDCLYRYMHSSRYIVFTDFNDIIVPKQHKNWLDLIKHLQDSDKHYNVSRSKVALSLRTALFRIDWPDEGPKQMIDRSLKLRTQLKLRREEKIWPSDQRIKYIIEPSSTVQVSIDSVFGDVKYLQVPVDLALLHHYRDWGGGGNISGIIDERMLEFGPDLQQSVIKVHKDIGLLKLNF